MHLVHTTPAPVRRDRLLRLVEVERVVGFKKSTIYALMRNGQFPRAIKVTSRCCAWAESAVLQWVQDRIGAADASGASTNQPVTR